MTILLRWPNTEEYGVVFNMMRFITRPSIDLPPILVTMSIDSSFKGPIPKNFLIFPILENIIWESHITWFVASPIYHWTWKCLIYCWKGIPNVITGNCCEFSHFHTLNKFPLQIFQPCLRAIFRGPKILHKEFRHISQILFQFLLTPKFICKKSQTFTPLFSTNFRNHARLRVVFMRVDWVKNTHLSRYEFISSSLNIAKENVEGLPENCQESKCPFGFCEGN